MQTTIRRRPWPAIVLALWLAAPAVAREVRPSGPPPQAELSETRIQFGPPEYLPFPSLRPSPGRTCLAQGGPVVLLAGHQTEKFDNDDAPLEDDTVINSTTAIWFDAANFPVQLVGGSDVCFSGGLIQGAWPPDQDWDTAHHSAAVYVKSPSITIEGVRIVTYGDGIRFRDGSSDFTVRGVYFSDIRDDCVSNDPLYSGMVDDSLFEGCYTAFSARPVSDEPGWDGRDNLWTIQNSLVYLHDQIGVYKGPSPGHGGFFKWDKSSEDLGPKLALHNNVFRVDSDSNHTGLGVPPGKLESCSNNTVVWLGPGEYPALLPDCFTITRDQAVWDDAVAAWKAAHGF